MMVIRTFRQSDLHDVMVLANRTLGEIYNPGIYTAIFQVVPEGFIVSYDNAKLTGLCVAVPEAQALRILMLSVDEEYRRSGIGRTLMKEIVSRFLARGFKSLTLEVRVGNDGGIGFYKELGFSITTMLPNFYSNGDSAYRMIKAIG
ncbi:MAG: GNAT family N-acetyltransferase [Thermoplasmata archaeon]|nr:GNAT family N-acetyltransferase [Thermoplasmata archaeon]